MWPLQMTKEEVMECFEYGFQGMTKNDILQDLFLECNKENLKELTVLLDELKADGVLKVYQIVGSDGKFRGRGYDVVEE